MKNIRYALEAFAILIVFIFMRLLPLDVASAIGAFLGRTVGPLFSAHRTAIKNLAVVFPEKSPEERDSIISGMWAHLGRVGAEFPHLIGNTLISRHTIKAEEYLPKINEPALFFSGHLGNWEILPSVPYRRGSGITIIYRHINNPFIDRIVAYIRKSQCDDMIAKGPRGAFKLAKALKKKKSICMLVDQKMNDGIAVPFFGRTAMTAPAIAQLALHYDLPIIPAQVVRTEGARFEIIIHPPMAYEKTGDLEKDTLAIMTTINATLESWIREKPEQWFWLHRRWPKQ